MLIKLDNQLKDGRLKQKKQISEVLVCMFLKNIFQTIYIVFFVYHSNYQKYK